MDRHELQRGIIIGVLLMMVIQSIAWLATPSERTDATGARYALNIATAAICALTAWATWRPNPRVQARLQQILARRV